MSKKKGFWASLFGGGSGCCCNMQITEKPDKKDSCCGMEIIQEDSKKKPGKDSAQK